MAQIAKALKKDLEQPTVASPIEPLVSGNSTKELMERERKSNEFAEKRGRENFYADFELSDNPYCKTTKQFLAWAYGFIVAKSNSH